MEWLRPYHEDSPRQHNSRITLVFNASQTQHVVVGEKCVAKRRCTFGRYNSCPESRHAYRFRDGEAAFRTESKPAFSLSSAADLILLPKPETTGYARGF